MATFRRISGICRQGVLLLDDVLTSGRTLLACRDALQDAGVNRLYYAVVAR
ncbi:hypothetical protein ACFSC4_17730 [Deinococcus malanensis]|uniref:hypothetical protein n=1 Tax=Deinococcus malanensis TaxID=1706855 RepID=UPI00363EB528